MNKEYTGYNLAPLVNVDEALDELSVINEFEPITDNDVADDLLDVIYSL